MLLSERGGLASASYSHTSTFSSALVPAELVRGVIQQKVIENHKALARVVFGGAAELWWCTEVSMSTNQHEVNKEQRNSSTFLFLQW